MFKFYRSVLAAGVVALGLAACGDNVTVQPPPPPSGGGVTSVTVTPANITIGVGQTEQLALNVVADSGVAKTVNWTTGNAARCHRFSTGVVTGVGLGSTSIIATSTANPSISGAVQVTVSNAATFSITPNTLNLAPGQSSNVIGHRCPCRRARLPRRSCGPRSRRRLRRWRAAAPRRPAPRHAPSPACRRAARSSRLRRPLAART